MLDQYLANPELLERQPKRSIADYVRQNGILVPTIFDSFEEAKASGKPFIARSEHLQDYDGVSGMLESPSFGIVKEGKDLDVNDEQGLKAQVLKFRGNIEAYCLLLGLDQSGFEEEVSFSFWEFLLGYNHTITADSAIASRYHITSIDSMNTAGRWIVYEKGEIIVDANPRNFLSRPENGIEKLIELYESVRHLGRFNPNHCPTMEFQTHEGEIYFLQYHRTRDFDPPAFSIFGDPEDGEVEALFVRGITPPLGIDYKVTVVDTEGDLKSWGDDRGLPKEDGRFHQYDIPMFEELMALRNSVHIFRNSSVDDVLVLAPSFDHKTRSNLFKPGISLVVADETLDSNDELIEAIYRAMETDQIQYMDLHIRSDGRRAFVKRI